MCVYILDYMEQFYYQPCIGSMGQSSGIEVTYSERSFSTLESTGQLTVTISLLEDTEYVFNLNVIPMAKYPLDAEGIIVCVCVRARTRMVFWTFKLRVYYIEYRNVNYIDIR